MCPSAILFVNWEKKQKKQWVSGPAITFSMLVVSRILGHLSLCKCSAVKLPLRQTDVAIKASRVVRRLYDGWVFA